MAYINNNHTAIKADINVNTEDIDFSVFVLKTLKIAGIDLADDITVTEMQEALRAYPIILYNGVPTPTTVGRTGQLYFDEISKSLYICIGKISSTYNWYNITTDLNKYVLKTRKIAGIDLTKDITAEELLTALNVPSFRTNFSAVRPESEIIGQFEYVGSGLAGRQKGLHVLIDDTGHRLHLATMEDVEASVQGIQGEKGADGTSVTVSSVSESTSDGGSNVVTFSDGKTLTVKNGSKGSKGDKGDKGDTGPKGADGYTPVRGVDYFTDTDKSEMVDAVIEKMNTEQEITIHEQVGGYYTTAGVWQAEPTVTSKYTDLIPVTIGEKFSYTGLGVWGCASVLWYDDAQQMISYEQHGEWNVSPTAVIITVPKAASFVRFCGINSDQHEAILEVSYYDEETVIQKSVLEGKKIVYDGDSICYGAGYKGGYAKLIADKVNGTYENQAVGGARLITLLDGYSYHSIVDNLPNLPKDGDLYCFDGGVNDYWTENVQLGSFDYTNFTGDLDTTTVCGALETIFRYCLNTFVGKPVCFVIVHKVQNIAYKPNSTGKTFKDYRDAMIGICEKYSIPYYDAFSKSGLNGWSDVHNQVFFTDGDGSHPTEAAYNRYYVPQLISLFESIMPTDVVNVELPNTPSEPTYTNLLEGAGYTKGVYLSGGSEKPDTNAFTTGFLKVGSSGHIYLKNVTLPDEESHGNRVALYDTNKNFIAQVSVTSTLAGWNAQFDASGNLTMFYFENASAEYIRLSAWNIDETSIITVNEPID